MVINCIEIANKIYAAFHQDLIQLKQAKNATIKMIIIKINNDKASEKYVNNKIKKAQELGIEAELIGDNIKNQEELLNTIKKLNNDPKTTGYIIQLPLPNGFDKDLIFDYVDITKDIDGLSSLAVSRNLNDTKLFHPIPCTARGIIEILKQSNFEIASKNVVVVNRSLIVGKPLIGQLLHENATVTICHSYTKDLKNITKNADVVICAIGKPHFFDRQYFNPNCFVIDAGISIVNQKSVGDVNFEDVKDYVKYITPVPNGVGKLTVAMIFKNLMELAKKQYYGTI
ncbi:MAG: bifunctional 5,10-methylenetetrahydrofolate dehydrogenase/5,10-methenyltetrahydrofolate cyclohydrolase [Malacoplasma sp.]|nr:bifunctional 5,10-methylenetetrahydrofolate dehydrogenase/5,10-methenyltetrahydrofolate cyclohydrolase [Malacoplasma sp.]